MVESNDTVSKQVCRMTNKVGKLNVNFGRSPVERMGARGLEPNELLKGLSGSLTPPGEIFSFPFNIRSGLSYRKNLI